MQHIVERTAPFWVHRNTAKAEPSHDHLRFGEPVTRTRPVLDENGERVLEPVESSVTLKVAIRGSFLRGYPARQVFIPEPVHREAKMKRSRGGRLTDLISYETGQTRQKRETVVLGHYADWCTVGEETNRDGALLSDPTLFPACVTWPSNYDDEKVYPRHPAEKMWSAPEGRVNTRAYTRSLTRAANSGIDLDDIEDDRRA